MKQYYKGKTKIKEIKLNLFLESIGSATCCLNTDKALASIIAQQLNYNSKKSLQASTSNFSRMDRWMDD